jgi:CTP synthase
MTASSSLQNIHSENLTTQSPGKTKYIFVTGGVVSSLGKGLSCASIGAILESKGLKVTALKLDPYINVDPGTMSPFQHGEVFVTDDGAETDLDLGHYERFLENEISQLNNFTSGKVYESVIANERRGDYLGGTVQVIPHITDEIKRRIRLCATGSDVCIVEVGGTVGDIESLPFIEAIRQMRADEGVDNVMYIHVTLVPYIRAANEFKTKPTQHSVKELTGFGILPNIILCRSEKPLDEKLKSKISHFCNVDTECVINAYDINTIYELPIILHREGIDEQIVRILKLSRESSSVKPTDLTSWLSIVETIKHPANDEVTVLMVGKYVELTESYKSVNEALIHGGIYNKCSIKILYLDSEEIEQQGMKACLSKFPNSIHGILVPGGFGIRGTEGMIQACKWAREEKIPYFGICLGLQIAVIEYARSCTSLTEATSSEFHPNAKQCVIDIMEDQKTTVDKGGSMRLGSYPCILKEGSLGSALYGNAKEIAERHRHRWEINNIFRDEIAKAGMKFSGFSPDLDLVEMIEIENHPWFLGVQFHPEFKSTPRCPHPIFKGFVAAMLKFREANKSDKEAA